MGPIAIEQLYAHLAAGRADELLAWFGDRPALDTSLDGAIAGEQALRRSVAAQQSWLRERRARSGTVPVIATADRTVAELVLFLRGAGGTIDLPVALAAEPGAGPFAAFHEMVLASGGGVPLRHCTATFDGRRFAVEYVCDWGRAKLPQQAGIGTYKMDDDGPLPAVRIYDDVSPPGEHSG